MKNLLKICAVLLLLMGCGGIENLPSQENIQKTEAALTPGTFNIGNASALVYNAPWSINYLTQYQDARTVAAGFPPAAINPSSVYQWGTLTNIDNGGSGSSCGGNPLTCAGNYNAMTFQTQNVGSSYYVAKVSAWISWNGGLNTTYYPNFLQAVVRGGLSPLITECGTNTQRTGDTVQFYWHAPTVEIYVLNCVGTVVHHVTATVNYNYGGAPNRIYSPSMSFTMDTSGAYGGCMHDVPNYNDAFGPNGDQGVLTLTTRYGNSQPSFAAYIGSPTSNSKCNMNSVDDSVAGNSTVRWDNPGF